MNSICFDWQARRFVEGHVSFFLLELLRLPDLVEEELAAIAGAAARLSSLDDRFAGFAAANGVACGELDETKRQRLRIDIDARVAHAWNLSASDLALIFRDFTEKVVPLDYRAALLDRFQELA